MASTSSTKLAPSSVAATDLAPPPPPPPATLLSLSSSGSDHFQQYQVCLKSCATTSTNTSAPLIIPQVNSKPNPDSTSRPSSSSLICFANKSGLEGMDSNPCGKRRAVDEENGENSSHVRHKRMIKNRESASRSRARKQAYTSELELKLELLKEENARLKMQQKTLCLGSFATPVAPARSLKRAHSL